MHRLLSEDQGLRPLIPFITDPNTDNMCEIKVIKSTTISSV